MAAGKGVLEMTQLKVSFNEILPIKDAVRTLSRVVDQLFDGEAEHFVITRRNEPRAVVVQVDRYERLLALERADADRRVV